MNAVDDLLDVVGRVLLRCAVMGILVLLLWWGVLACCGDLAYGVHTRWFPMTRERFDMIHYTGILATKAAVSILFVIPYVAVRLVAAQRHRPTE